MSAETAEAGAARPAPGRASSKEGRLWNRPVYLLATTAGTILVAEVLVMLLLSALPPMTPFAEDVLDGATLTLLIFPSLYFFVFKPLNRNIAERRRAEADKDALIAELQKALGEVKTLRGIVPICASCKKIRDDQGFWHQVEVYVADHSDALFTHGLCPECVEKLYPSAARAALRAAGRTGDPAGEMTQG